MKKYAADNLMFLREHYPQIYTFVRNRVYDKSRLVPFESRNGQANLLIKDADGRETSLYSRYNPAEEAAKWAAAPGDMLVAADHVLFFGFGFGYHIQAFIHAYPDKKVYIYEPEAEYLLAAIECCDLRKVLDLKQIAVFAVGDDPGIQAHLLGSVYRSVKDSFAFAALPAYRKLHLDKVEHFFEKVKQEATNYQANLQTHSYFQQEWAENIILNLERNLKSCSFASMRGACTGIPAVIVGSGPSLNMEIENVRKLKEYAIIIAAGSSAQALLKHNIEPDLIVSIDAGEANFKVFEKLDLTHIPFIYTPVIKHTILEKEIRHLMHFFIDVDMITHYFMKINEEQPVFLSTATVTGAAIQAAIYMNCSEIVFIGQDFSFPNDIFYAQGVEHIDKSKLNDTIAKADLMTPNVQGGLNRTTQSMLVLKDSVEQLITIYEFDEYYNASAVGAVIENTKPKTLAQLLEERKNQPLENGWFKKLMKERLTPYSDQYKQSVLKRINETSNDIKKYKKMIEKLEKLLESAGELEFSSNARITGWFEKFDEIWNRVTTEEVFKNIYFFLLQREVNYIERYWSELSAEDNSYEKVLKLNRTISPIMKGFNTVTPVLEGSFEKLLQRMQ